MFSESVRCLCFALDYHCLYTSQLLCNGFEKEQRNLSFCLVTRFLIWTHSCSNRWPQLGSQWPGCGWPADLSGAKDADAGGWNSAVEDGSGWCPQKTQHLRGAPSCCCCSCGKENTRNQTWVKMYDIYVWICFLVITHMSVYCCELCQCEEHLLSFWSELSWILKDFFYGLFRVTVFIC